MSTPTLPLSSPEILKDSPIRRFADSHLQESIDKAIAGIPPDRHGAVIAHVDGEGVSLTTVARLGEHWSVVMTARDPWKGKLEGEAAVKFSW
jgi:hypothetical protein